MATKIHELPPVDPLRRYPVDQTLVYLGISRKFFYDEAAAGRIATIKHGKRRFCPGSEIVRLSQAPA